MVELIYFWAPWCMPCKIVSPIVEELECKVTKVNVEENPELAAEMDVLNIPTIVIMKDGVEVDRLIGVNTKETICQAINS